MKKTLSIVAVIVMGLAGSVSTSHGWFWSSGDDKAIADAREIGWEDLVPDDFIPPANPLDTMSEEELNKLFDGSEESQRRISEIEIQLAYAPTVPDLSGQRIRIPAYIVPLDFDGATRFKEFLLVPYYGACIHTPPPPANQVVHAMAVDVITVEDTFSPVWAIGTLHTETVRSNLAEAGYKLEVEYVEPYTEP